MKPKLKPWLDLDAVQEDMVLEICEAYRRQNGLQQKRRCDENCKHIDNAHSCNADRNCKRSGLGDEESKKTGGRGAVSIRSIARDFDISPMKVRKILITANLFHSSMASKIAEMHNEGKMTVKEIATALNTTVANVNSYLPYQKIIYDLEEKSVNADKQERYRHRQQQTETCPKKM